MRGSKPFTDTELLNAFAEKVDKRGTDECWEWTGARNRRGYGVVKARGRITPAPRLSWKFFFGPIPEGKMVLHKCDNPSCVNPYHLYLGSQRDNMTDAVKRGRLRPYRPPCKLYDEEIWLVRRLLERKPEGIDQRFIGRMFKVDQSVVSRINTQSDYPSKGSVSHY